MSEQQLAYEMLPPKFWQSTPWLARIRKTALARGAYPSAVLGVCVARMLMLLPPNIVTPAYRGNYGTLNYYVAVVGESADGKGTAAAVAAQLVPDFVGGNVGKVASGEAVASQFAARVPDGEGRNAPTHVEMTRARVLLDVPEVCHFGASSSRIGSTLSPELASGWSGGEQLGASTKDGRNTITAPGYGYRLTMVTGVQDGNADALLSQSTTGIPQRFLWVDTVDPEPLPDTVLDYDVVPLIEKAALPDVPEMTLQAAYREGSLYSTIGCKTYFAVMEFPQCVKRAVDDARKQRNEEKRLGTTDGESTNGHRLLVQIKTAAAFAWLDYDRANHMVVTEHDWRLAGMLLDYSDHVRDYVAEKLQTAATRKAARAKLTHRAAEAATAADVEAVKNKVLAKVEDAFGQPVTYKNVRNSITTRLRPFVRTALDELCNDHQIVPVVGDDGTTRYTTA